MDNLKKAGKAVVDFMGIVVPSISFIMIFITFMISICSRYFFRSAVTWSYEVSVLGYMWTMFFGVGKAIEADEHVVFGLVYDTLKPLSLIHISVAIGVFLYFFDQVFLQHVDGVGGSVGLCRFQLIIHHIGNNDVVAEKACDL